MPDKDKTKYVDGRPEATLRMDACDQGVILSPGGGPVGCDSVCIREPIINLENGIYHLFYDGLASDSWRACLAVSTDLANWAMKGPLLDLGQPGEMDSVAAVSPWVIRDGNEWHMFYIGSPNAIALEGSVLPVAPYVTLKARSRALAGPWVKDANVVPFTTRPNTFYAVTASAGHIIKHADEYLMFFSGSTNKPGSDNPALRTVGIARTKDLNGEWTVDPMPIVPLEEQIENTSLYFEEASDTWFLFTNHIGFYEDEEEYTDAAWVYWSKDLNVWDSQNKAIVLDGQNCTWSSRCVGMPSVIRVGNRLAVFYDAPGSDSTSHFGRSIGLAWLDLPLRTPLE